ncbi:PREDICTED: sister chromatid cohesion 1 protein 2 [Lupinus angustifolius]|uniref:sister chromatid cohesion 1 protein 2 n=1 Tax=Lupinus angustifolius TaxID=3871 RepID=UPI00092FA149|nr:PREDICTED: sister chromatid cohesion 1 protein 2 [Lupinus angustifolius]
MVNTLSFHSRRKTPLWVAAYCFHELNKAQVFDSNISSIVDKILREEIDVVSYRVLSYLLLGVVRIFSRKVDYLSYDCDEVLIKINKFVINRKELARVENLRMSVTIPDRFELDAFELDALEDTSRSNIASKEDITLQDVSSTNERFGLLSLEKVDEFDSGESGNPVNHLMLEDIHQSVLMEMDFEFCNMPFSADQSDLMELDFEVFRSNSPINSLPGKDMDLNTVVVDAGAEEESSDLFSKDRHINTDERVQLTAPYEDQIPEKCRIPLEASADISMIFGTRNERIDHDDYLASMENTEEVTQGPLKKLKFQEKFPIQGVTLSVIPPQSENLDATPQSMFQGASVGRPTLGGMSPNFMLISTPALSEGTRLSRKRKTIDKTIIISNNMLKKRVEEANDLVSGRRKSCPILLTTQKKPCTSRISVGSHVSSLPCKSSKIRILFSKKKLRLRKKLKIAGTPGNSRVAESQTVANLRRVAASPKTPPRSLAIKGRSIEHPARIEIENSDSLGPLTPLVSIEVDQSSKRVEGRNPTKEFNVGNSISFESVEKELSLAEVDDLNLMNGDISSSETENSELIAGWSVQTGKIAKSLQRKFQDQKNKQEEEVVNFSQVVKGKPRNQCAKLFYEMLVLKTTSCVDVKQDSPYADIAIKKQPKLDETLATYEDM